MEINGIYYNLKADTKSAEVTYGTNKYSGTVTIPSSIKNNGVTYSVTSIGYRAFDFCKSLTSVTIPNSVTNIGNEALDYCTSLVSITIPNSVTSIGHKAFYGCSSLSSVTIPNSVTEIGQSAFGGCSSLPVIGNLRYAGTFLVEAVDKKQSSYSIKEGTRYIGMGAFEHCTSLISITIPSSVTRIDAWAFNDCTSLTSVRMTDIAAWCKIVFSGNPFSNPLYYAHNLYLKDKLVKDLAIPNSVTSIGEYSFYNCSSLTSVTISNSVAAIGSSAFNNCSSLTSVNIPNSVASIGIYTFYGCSSLTSVIIPNSVTNIGAGLFAGCSSLTSITIPTSVTNIGESGFAECSSLTSITIPNSVTSIGSGGLANCTSLTVINSLNPTPPDCGQNVFFNVPKYIAICVPKGSAGKYRSAIGWKEFTNTVERNYASFSLYSGNTSFTVVDGVLEDIIKTDLSNNGLAFIDRKDITETLPSNYIKKNSSGKWIADKIELVDAKPFYCPEDVQAKKISYSRIFNNTNYQAWYVPFAVPVSAFDGKAEVAYVNNVHQYDYNKDGVVDKTTLEFISLTNGTLEANQPYVIKPFATGKLNLEVENATLKSTTVDGYVDCRSTTHEYVLRGIYQELGMYGTSHYGMSEGKFVTASEPSHKLSPFRMCLDITARNASVSVKKMPTVINISVDGIEDNATRIDITPTTPDSYNESLVSR